MQNPDGRSIAQIQPSPASKPSDSGVALYVYTEPTRKAITLPPRKLPPPRRSYFHVIRTLGVAPNLNIEQWTFFRSPTPRANQGREPIHTMLIILRIMYYIDVLLVGCGDARGTE